MHATGRHDEAAEFLGAKQVAEGVTPYEELKGSFSLDGGRASNRDLELTGDVISFKGGGLIDVGAREVDYVINITRFGKISIIDEILGRAFPIVLRGSWDALKIGNEKDASPARIFSK